MKASGIILIGLAFLLAISSCATVPQAPLGPGKVRLLKMDIPQNGTVSANVEYLITIYLESEGNIEIKRVCFNFSGDQRYCDSVDPKGVTYGPHPSLRVPIHVPVGQRRLDVYAEYAQNGEIHRTNTLSSFVNGYEFAVAVDTNI